MNLFFYRDGQLREGLPIQLMLEGTKILERRAESPQDAWGYAILGHNADESVSVKVVSTDGSKATTKHHVTVFSLPAVARVAQGGDEGVTLNIARSGAYTVVDGATSDPAPVLPTPTDATPLEQQAYAWLRDGRVGSSSYALCVALTGVESPNKNFPVASDIPYDCDDFSRCVAFFEAVPLARPFLESMNQGGPGWKALVPVWHELEELFAAGDRRAVSDRIRAVTSGVKLTEDSDFLGLGTTRARALRP
jgi:hypothetical protein